MKIRVALLTIILVILLLSSGCSENSITGNIQESKEIEIELEDRTKPEQVSWSRIKSYFLENRADFERLFDYFNSKDWEYVQLLINYDTESEFYDIYNIEGRRANDDEISEINSILQDLDFIRLCGSIYYEKANGASCNFGFRLGATGVRVGDPDGFLVVQKIVDNWYLYEVPHE